MTTPLRVLILEDNPADLEMVLRELRLAGFEPEWECVETEAAYQERLRPDLDIILSDYVMPQFSGPRALEVLQATGLDVPFIILSGTVGEDEAVEVMRRGAYDYLLKDRLTRLGPAVNQAMEKVRLQRESRRIDEALQESRRRLDGIVTSAMDAILALDADQHIVLANPAVERMFGYTAAELLGKRLDQLIPERFRATHSIEIAEFGRAGVGGRMGALRAVSGLRKNGEEFPIEATISHYESSGLRFLIAILRDMTEHTQLEDALRQQQTELRTLFDLLPAMLWLKDTTNRIVRVNKQAALAVDRSVAEIEGRSAEEIYPREAAADFADDLEVIQGGVPKQEVIERRSDATGGDSWVQTDKVPVCDASGRVTGIFVMAQDITQRMQAEKVLRESERRFSGLLSNVELAAVMLDRNGLITYCNDYLLRLCGWRIEEVLGQDWFVLFAPPVLGNAKTTFAAQLEDLPAARQAEIEILTRAGERRLIRWSNSTLRSVTGAVTGTASIGEDITQQRLSEVRINRLHRVSEMLTAINSLIVHVNDRDELFRGACDIAMKQGHFRMAWIGMVDKSGQLIVPVAAEGAEPDFLALVEGRTSVLEAIPLTGSSMTARAVREKRAIVSNEIVGDTTMVLSKARIDRGIVSMAILPLLVSGSAVGVFALYAAESAFFDAEEMALLTQLAGDISFGVDHIEKQERIDYLAYYDVLTGLANRRLFLERVAQYARSAAAGDHMLALCKFDLERFKSVNDSFGRSTGDELLRQVATWLTLNVADASLLARVDRDHFAVVMPKLANESDAARLAESSLAALVEHTFQVNGVALRVAAKVGVALFPDDGTDADTLLTNAEIALRRAKTSGNRYMMFTPKMTEAVAGRLVLETQLRDALRNEEFVLHYQPKVSLATGRVVGAEALLRWNNPRTGLVAPGRFIPVLEETGLILEAGTWVLRQVIEDYRSWSSMGLDPGRIAVNISALQMRQRGFVEMIKQMIGTERQYAAALELELTESLFMDDISVSIEQLRAIRELGVTIAIDDFGTGFSALSYLTRLPIDTIKIDGSFVRDMTSGPSGLALVSTIIALGHALKLNVVGEGVETEEQSRLLHLLRCDEMQGFFYSRPLAAGQFEALLVTHASPAKPKVT